MRKTLMSALLGAGAFAAMLAAAPTASAEAQLYVGGSVGYVSQQDSDNSGRTGAFNTGNGNPTPAAGTPVAAGTPYGWNTEFDDGYTVSGEAGFFYDSGFRSGIELAYSKSDVDRHSGATLGGTAIDGVDAAALTGSAAPLGVTVGQALARDDGEISNLALYANLYYDFNREGQIRPYLGAGVGVAKVDVEYKPSGISVIDDDDTVLAYQAKAGVSWAINDSTEVYGEYAYRATDDLSFQNKLFPGTLDIENEQHAVSVGVRFKTGTVL